MNRNWNHITYAYFSRKVVVVVALQFVSNYLGKFTCLGFILLYSLVAFGALHLMTILSFFIHMWWGKMEKKPNIMKPTTGNYSHKFDHSQLSKFLLEKCVHFWIYCTESAQRKKLWLWLSVGDDLSFFFSAHYNRTVFFLTNFVSLTWRTNAVQAILWHM